MKSKTSFFSKGIILDDIRRFGWISIVHALALFFVVPLKILMLHSSEQVNKEIISKEIIKNMFYLTYTQFQSFLIIIVPVLLGIFLFRYMQVKTSTDMIHSLPVKRSVLYRSHVAVGIISLIIPVVVIAIISIFLNKTLDLGQYYRIYDVVQWCGITILFNLVFFFVSVLVGMIVGSSVLQGVLTYILLFLPIGLTLLVTESLNTFVYGFMNNISQDISRLSPIARIFQGFQDYHNINRKISITELIVYIVLCIIIYFLAEIIYNKRKMEAAAQSIAFKSLQYVFKYASSFCVMLLVGAYFKGTQGNIQWILFGFFIGSLIGYFAAEMIVKKSLWVFKSIKGYIVYAVVIIVVMQGIKFDVIGYESKIPNINEVQSIYFSEGFNEYYQKFNMYIYSDKKDLQSIHDFHKQLIQDKTKNKGVSNKNKRSIVFQYTLKDGSKIQRGYYVSYDGYQKYFKPIYESNEYKSTTYDMLGVDVSDVEKITINPRLYVNKQAIIIKPEDIKEAMEVLKQDISNETYEDMSKNKADWADMTFIIQNDKLKKYPRLNDEARGNKEGHLAWKKSYKLFEQWLNKKGYLENSRVLPKDIEYAVVEKVDNDKQWEEKRRTGEYINKNNGKSFEIKDKNQIETCLRNYENLFAKYGGNNGKYVIGFYSTDKNKMEYGTFDEDSAPDFIKAYFSK
ncbi:DUF6449 domain-containing protein [Clostridium sp. DJ247]|uniref:DUF6449 domain-containing protein n=1 Tax=Clostridium sp. DJ247 TaxID=2726188 RepID=UPI001626C6C1|nr:DUF6449 domain-containing protein [Clostridium sp. DJ247]MBC2580731.1 ABC transporter permease [Clostridium sp. DJ247]